MKLKYKDIEPLNADTRTKLSMVSFDTPEKNISVYRFLSAIEAYANDCANEYNKMVMKHGEKTDSGNYIVEGKEPVEAFLKEWTAFTDLDIDAEIPLINITEADLENASYPPEKRFWLNAKEIKLILRFCETV